MEDVKEQPGMLPLVQYALTELFERRQGRNLTLAAYEDSALRERLFKMASFPGLCPDAGAQIFNEMGIEVLVSTENDKDFENNMVTIRAEERLAFAVYRPEAFVTGDLTAL